MKKNNKINQSKYMDEFDELYSLEDKENPSFFDSIFGKLAITFFVISFALLIVVAFVITKPLRDGNKEGIINTNDSSEEKLFTPEEKVNILYNQTEFEKDHVEVMDEDMELLKKYQAYNDECVGIISIEDSVLNHPLMQSPDDEDYYLTHDLDKNGNSHGVPFLTLSSDIDREDGNNIIYGHNIRTSDRDVFADLTYYEDSEYYKTHPVIKLVTDSGTRYYIIFAYYLIDTEDGEFVYWDDTIWGSKTKYKEYMDEVEKRNWLKNDVPYNYEDQFLTLSTCSVELAHSGTNRMVVMARLLGLDEDYTSYIENAQNRANPWLPKKLR